MEEKIERNEKNIERFFVVEHLYTLYSVLYSVHCTVLYVYACQIPGSVRRPMHCIVIFDPVMPKSLLSVLALSYTFYSGKW